MNDNENSALVIVPTMGDPELVIPCVQRLLTCTQVNEWRLMLVVNPLPERVADGTIEALRQQVQATIEIACASSPQRVRFEWVQMGAPAGWTGAVNEGVRVAMSSGLPASVCILNDDVRVTPGWLHRMHGALTSPDIRLQGEVAVYGQAAPCHPVEGYGRIGMVGPVSNVVAGVQCVRPPDVRLGNGTAFTADGDAILDRWSSEYAESNGWTPMAASFLSGLCVLYLRECLLDLLETHGGEDCLLRPAYGVGGYDDNDVAVRAQLAGWRMAIATSCYVHHLGHQTLDKHFPQAQRGMANAATYLREWEAYTSREQRMVAVWRVQWSTPFDLAMFRNSVIRAAQLADGLAVLATGTPAAVMNSEEWQLGRLPPEETQLVATCAAADATPELVAEALRVYLAQLVALAGLPHPVEVATGAWAGQWNERDERNASIALGMTLRPDWMLSVDHDEVVEDRVTRAQVQRLLRNPDPLVQMYDVGWANHWDSPRLCRVDAPWCAPEYRSSMRGFRLWRVTHPSFQRVLAGNAIGLHCGNVPDAGENSKRVAGFRFRHYGYMRPNDRTRKWKRYNELDPQPEAQLTQGTRSGAGGYDHLVREENMVLQPFQAANGIGFTMLYHAGEHLFDLHRHLDQAYALADRIVLVWTGEAGSGPDADALYVASRYGAEWVYQPLNDDLSTARNAGVDKLREYGLTWCWVMDPDESYESDFLALVALRRMAEVTDGWAWMFRFKNYRADGQWNWSENTRMFRLDAGILRFSLRVHETLEHGLAELGKRGIHPQVRYAPFIVNHRGLAGGPEAMQAKLERYTRLLVRQLEDTPASPGAWVSLGLQYGNDGRKAEQWQCYEAAMQCTGNGYLPFREAALHHLRAARHLVEQALARLAPSHTLHQQVGGMQKWLEENAPDQPLLGVSQSAVPADVQLAGLLDKFRQVSNTDSGG